MDTSSRKRTTDPLETDQNLPSQDDIVEKIEKLNLNEEKVNQELGLQPKRIRFHECLKRHIAQEEMLLSEAVEKFVATPENNQNNRGSERNKEFSLGHYSIPRRLFQLLAQEKDISSYNEVFTQPLDALNYSEKFQTLLWVEEAHLKVAMHRYDLTNVKLAAYSPSLYLLRVPGLAEGRPSLMKRDKVILNLHGTRIRKCWIAYITEVRDHDIIFKIGNYLPIEEKKFDVSFGQSRTPHRRCHHGVTELERIGKLKEVAFPGLNQAVKTPSIDIRPNHIRFFNKKLNEYQKRAVVNILRSVNRPSPYLLFGPPGTGKTVTLVEAVLQVYKLNPSAKILICGNTNASVDIITQRIFDSKTIPAKHLLRLSAFYRLEEGLIPEDLLDITCTIDDLDALSYREYRVVTSTCNQACSLYEFKDKFDFVFVDEAGHATEPEAMIALGLMKEDASFVLAGDPHQLGPVCQSNISKDHGLGISLLERLFNLDVYQRREINGSMVYDNQYITKLNISYRCDSRVMVVNNALFYDNELKFKVKTSEILLKKLNLENPLIFHAVKGKESRYFNQPSWCNLQEATQCLFYVERLYRAGLKPEQVGVITPYRLQIEMIRKAFIEANRASCKIDTMEGFQGDEKEVIIISTVRVTTHNLNLDKLFNLGFLFNKKRFNVGVSRSKWICIVIGNKELLEMDECWNKYIKAAQIIENRAP